MRRLLKTKRQFIPVELLDKEFDLLQDISYDAKKLAEQYLNEARNELAQLNGDYNNV